MSALYYFAAILGLIGFLVAGFALARGRLRWAGIANRQIALAAMLAAFAVFVVGVATGNALAGNVPAPPLSSAAPAVAGTTVASPVVVSSVVVPPPSPAGPAVTATTAPPPPVIASPPPTAAAPVDNHLTCLAQMSNSTPADNSATVVIVETGVAGAEVTTTAHYKTTDTTHAATSDGSGNADIPYLISRATPGYTVRVDVTVTDGPDTQTCLTSFTPA